MSTDINRKLVTLESISALSTIPGADFIELAQVRGWNVVVRKGEFEVGQVVLYFEIDSLLPLDTPAFEFLAPRGEKIIDGVRYHRLKTTKLRGVYSQGLVLPLHVFTKTINVVTTSILDNWQTELGVIKYEPPLPPSAKGEIIGGFPTQLARKTDSERIQNLSTQWPAIVDAGPWVATEKVDGCSVTVVRENDEYGDNTHSGRLRCMSRNWEIAEGDNLYWNAVREFHLDELLQNGECIQFELYGENIQGNPLKIKGRSILIFAYTYKNLAVPLNNWPKWTQKWIAPIYDLEFPSSIEEAIEQVDDIKSLLNPERLAEGVVWHRKNGEPLPELDYRSTWKAISNKYLLKHEG